MAARRGGSSIGKGQIRAKLTLTPSPAIIARAFNEAGVEFGDWRPAWPRAAGAMRAGIIRGLQSEGSSLGESWPKINAVYQAHKLREGHGGRRLVRKGRLLGHALSARPVSAGKRSLSVGFSGKRWQHLPALQFKRGFWFVGWDEQARREVRAALEAYVQDVFARVRQKLGRSQ